MPFGVRALRGTERRPARLGRQIWLAYNVVCGVLFRVALKMQIESTKEHDQMYIKASCNQPQNVRQYIHDSNPQLSSSFANPLPALKPLPAPQTQPAVRFRRGGGGSWGSVLPAGCSRADRILQHTHRGSGSQRATGYQPPGASQPAARHEASNRNKPSGSHGTSQHAPCHPCRPDCYHLQRRFFKQQQRLERGFHGRVRVKLQFVGLL